MVYLLNLEQNKLGKQFHRVGKIRVDLFREDMDGIHFVERLVYTFSRDYILLQLDVLTMMIIENISWVVRVKNNYSKPVEIRKSNRFAKTVINKFFHCIPCAKVMTVHISAVISFIRDTRTARPETVDANGPQVKKFNNRLSGPNMVRGWSLSFIV